MGSKIGQQHGAWSAETNKGHNQYTLLFILDCNHGRLQYISMREQRGLDLS